MSHQTINKEKRSKKVGHTRAWENSQLMNAVISNFHEGLLLIGTHSLRDALNSAQT